MKLKNATIQNFRRLENVNIDFEQSETVFVGPNNSGKTSATSIFRCFLSSRDFKIHDFSMQKIAEIDEYQPSDEIVEFPEIVLDLWFEFDPDSITFGRVFSLLSSVSLETNETGIRCSFKMDDIENLWSEYNAIFPANTNGIRSRSLSYFLSLDGNIKRYFVTSYSALERLSDGRIENTLLKPAEGKRILNSLIRADFVDAQRNMNDDEEASRSSKLSSAFASFYRNNLDQAAVSDAAVQIIDENNQKLTQHYDEHFRELMNVLDGLGVPAAHERRLKIVSDLSADVALKGSTDLIYIDGETEHELPEAYNGLGFKNLVLMAIQIRDYQLQWLQTEENRPLCHMIFIEEPEVHLHPQVQQTFISNMWNILNSLNKDQLSAPQLVISTHSSHVLNSIEFEKVRYFRRCHRPDEDAEETPILRVSEVHNLRNFRPTVIDAEDVSVDESEVLEFLKRYLALTHCDLFFSDAAILIEGTVERLLLPSMIKNSAPKLKTKYLTTLEVGGAFAHRFSELLEFLHVPYLVITDIDSVKKTSSGGRAKACCARDADARTSNASLKAMFGGIQNISDFTKLTTADQAQDRFDRFIAFQKPIKLSISGQEITVHGRTLEETFIYENISLCDQGMLLESVALPENIAELNETIFELIKSSSFKKTEFALTVLASDEWAVPSYISEGLIWLSDRLQTPNSLQGA